MSLTQLYECIEKALKEYCISGKSVCIVKNNYFPNFYRYNNRHIRMIIKKKFASSDKNYFAVKAKETIQESCHLKKTDNKELGPIEIIES